MRGTEVGPGRRLALGLLLAVLTVLGSSSPAWANQVFYPSDRYDCSAYQAATGHTVYVDSYQFESGNRYAVGFRRPGSRTGLSKQFGSGLYKVVGKKIVSTSGYLTRQHEYLLIQANDLALVKNSGAFQRIGCYDTRTHSTGSGGGGTFLGGAASVQYSCYQTTEVGGAYYAGYPFFLTFYSDGTYLKQYSIRTGTAWHQSANTIVFTAGPFWQDASPPLVDPEHDAGTWYPSGGVHMTNAPASDASLTFSLVIKDTRAEDGNPPSAEFSTTDGPNGSSSSPMSFLYCQPS